MENEKCEETMYADELFDMISQNTDDTNDVEERNSYISEICVGQIEDFGGDYGLRIKGEWYRIGTFEDAEEAKSEIEELAEIADLAKNDCSEIRVCERGAGE